MSIPPGPPPSSDQPGGPDRRLLRAGSQDRDRVTEILTAAYRDGRLTDDEYMDRASAARTAVTYGDLDRLVEDLPAGSGGPVDTVQPTPPVGPAPLPMHETPSDLRANHGSDRSEWRTWAFASALCVGIWLFTVVATRSVAYFWPVWVIGPWGAVILAKSLFGD